MGQIFMLDMSLLKGIWYSCRCILHCMEGVGYAPLSATDGKCSFQSWEYAQRPERQLPHWHQFAILERWRSDRGLQRHPRPLYCGIWWRSDCMRSGILCWKPRQILFPRGKIFKKAFLFWLIIINFVFLYVISGRKTVQIILPFLIIFLSNWSLYLGFCWIP